jgi:hypothetical protein
MKKSFWLWVIAFVLTAFIAIYQRVTGPTYPITGEVILNDQTISYKLDRSHGGEGDHYIEITTEDQSICGELIWKRYKTDDDWTSVEMKRLEEKLVAALPQQPPAGKLVYHILLQKNDSVIKLPEEGEVIIRFKGDVPIYFLIPHIIFIFGAMLLSTRTGLEYFSAKGGYASGINDGRKFKSLTILTFIFLIIGGFILGPIIQYYAFGAFWTGFPFGHDLTDNKVLIAFIGWILALIAVFKFKNPKAWIIFASILMFIIFLIPHSLLGSELDYSKLDTESKIEIHSNRSE